MDSARITRIWSLDLQWMRPGDAEEALQRLQQTGWLRLTAGGHRPGVDISAIVVPLGWQPRLRLLLNPPACPAMPLDAESEPELETKTKMQKQGEQPPQVEEYDLTQVLSGDSMNQGRTSIEAASEVVPNAVPLLLTQISELSGIAKQEVMRRAQRKKRGLGPVTLWMALLLVASEQKLDTTELFSTVRS
jgi:hypothetical protein